MRETATPPDDFRLGYRTMWSARREGIWRANGHTESHYYRRHVRLPATPAEGAQE